MMLAFLSANLYWQVKNPKKALGLTRRILDKQPNHWEARALYRKCLRFLLQFDAFEKDSETFVPLIEKGDISALHCEKLLDNLQWYDNEIVQSTLTGVDANVPYSASLRRMRPHGYGDKIRIGYLSNDFSDRHATMHLFQGVLKAHDRSKFTVTLFCHTDEDVIAVDEGFRSGNAEIAPIAGLNDADAAALIRSHSIDILVDLKGHTRDARWSILNVGAAPVQVSYLGFPGFTTGIDCDYIIGDATVIPDESRDLYRAKVVRMPDSYQANDDTGRALPPAADRKALGLPENRIIFAAFNSLLKLTPRTFRLWMEIMQRVESSSLWVQCEHADVQASLLLQCSKMGIAENRILFAARTHYTDHIARLQAADIALDTFPYNGHTTSSDALWAGLPLPTIKGSNFASRVTESLLKNLGLPELVCENEAAYVEAVVGLALNADARHTVRCKIGDNRFSSPLFDTERFARHLESAFETMVLRAKSGQAPEHFDVAALAPRQAPFKQKRLS
jgi:predicted O-linked N-acetylglucosamine transferase (SPINDLY family)